jgi:hypothetical protein
MRYRTSPAIAFDGASPNRMVCDTTLREVPDGTWALLMLAGGNFEPSPENYTGITRSSDLGKHWTPLERVDVGFARAGETIGQGPTELMVLGSRSRLFFSTHAQTWGRDWRSWMIHSDDNCCSAKRGIHCWTSQQWHPLQDPNRILQQANA